MIDETTPSKLVEIIHDTWPNIFRPPLTNLSKGTTMHSIATNQMKIEIYTTKGCGYCVKVKELMSRAGVSYEEKIFGRDFSREELLTKYPLAHGYPYVVINDQPIGGLVDTVKYFVENGLVSSK